MTEASLTGRVLASTQNGAWLYARCRSTTNVAKFAGYGGSHEIIHAITPRTSLLAGIAVSGPLAVNLVSSVRAEVTVTGISKDARIETSDATLEQLLSALRERLDVAYTSSAALDHKLPDGTFAGPLTKILVPLLAGYDHFMKVQDGHISLVVTAQQKATLKENSNVATGAATSSAAKSPHGANTSSDDTSKKNQIVTDSKNDDLVNPNGPSTPPQPTAPSTSPPPSPFVVTSVLGNPGDSFL